MLFNRIKSTPVQLVGAGLLTALLVIVSVFFLRQSPESALAILIASMCAIGALIILCFTFWRMGISWSESIFQARLINTLEKSGDAAFVTNGSGSLIYTTNALHQLFRNNSLSEFVIGVDISFMSKVIKKGSEPELSALIESMQTNSPSTRQLQIADSNNNSHMWRVSVNPIGGSKGDLLWVVSDVTVELATAVKTKEENEFVAALLDHLPVGFFSADKNGMLQYVNKTLAEWLSVDQDYQNKISQRSLADFIVRNEKDQSEPEIESDPSGMHGGLKLQNEEGEEFYVYLIQSQKEDEDGQFLFSRSIVLREPFTPVLDDGTGVQILRRFPWLFSDSPVGIVLLDLNGTVLDCNRSFLKILGLHRDGVVGRPISERIAKSDRDTTNAALAKVAMKTMRAVPLEVRVPTDGEREITASFDVTGLENSEGEITGLVMHVRDTTDEKTLEVQFNQAQKMQTVGQLAGGVAHNFNNLLTAMGGFCDLILSRHSPDDQDYSDIMQIKENAKSATTLVSQLLAFSRRQTLEPKIFSITDRLNYLSGTLPRMIGENIEIELIHGRNVDLIRTDQFQFDHVIFNLSVNARHAMPGGGTITITTEHVPVENAVQRGHDVMPAGEYIRINFADTGSGIAPENLNQIFQPFFTTKGVGEGTGLGLSTVYGIIRQSDGYIFVDSALGEGTTFSIYLPAFSAAEIQAFGGEISEFGEAEELNDKELMGEATVLLVEDEDAVRVFGSRALKNKGYRVLEAEDGEKALDVINQFGSPIDLIITDVMMPGMDGHTLVRLVQEELPDIKVILMSGYAEDVITGDISGDREINFLSKPFSLNQLAIKVKEVIAA